MKDLIIYNIIRKRVKSWRFREPKAFDSSAIGDLAFLLLIFFIVTSSFILRQGIFLSLPSNSSGAIRMEENELFEIYPLNDNFEYDGGVLTRREFKGLLKEHTDKHPKGALLIYMNPDVKYHRLIDTLSVAKEVGQSRVSLKNIKED